MKNLRKIFLLFFIFMISGCTIFNNEKEIISNNNDDNIKEETKINEYVDDNPIKLGIFLYDNNYHNKERLYDTFYANFINGVDIGSFEVFLTDDEIIDGNRFKDTWNKYYNMYTDIDNYKIGYNITYKLKDGTTLGSNFFEPDIFRYGKYFYVYLYDDINAPDGFYSHLEDMNDDTIITSIKIYAVEGIDDVEEITLTAFTYDNQDDFDDNNNYRGNSKYTITIKRK